MAIQRYIDRNNDSGVIGYEVGPGWIHVHFKGGSVYEYTEATCGKGIIQQMHQLAASGDGLNSFINLQVRKICGRKVQ